jgi:hypothetical protein
VDGRTAVYKGGYMRCLDGMFELNVIVFMIACVFYFIKHHQCMKYTTYYIYILTGS